MSHLPASIFQISRSDAWNLTISPDAARNMRDLAAQIGAGMPKYLIAPEVSLLLSYIDDLNIRMYFETLWNTGARLNEALALKPADFMLTPTRQYPQPVVILKTLKQRLKEAERRPGRPTTRHPPLIQKTTGACCKAGSCSGCQIRIAYAGIPGDLEKADQTSACVGHNIKTDTAELDQHRSGTGRA